MCVMMTKSRGIREVRLMADLFESMWCTLGAAKYATALSDTASGTTAVGATLYPTKQRATRHNPAFSSLSILLTSSTATISLASLGRIESSPFFLANVRPGLSVYHTLWSSLSCPKKTRDVPPVNPF